MAVLTGDPAEAQRREPRVRWGEETQGSDVTDAHTWVFGAKRTLCRRRVCWYCPRLGTVRPAGRAPAETCPACPALGRGRRRGQRARMIQVSRGSGGSRSTCGAVSGPGHIHGARRHERAPCGTARCETEGPVLQNRPLFQSKEPSDIPAPSIPGGPGYVPTI